MYQALFFFPLEPKKRRSKKTNNAWSQVTFGVSGFICESLTSMAECADSTPTIKICWTCVYLHHRRSKFVYFVRKLSLTMILGDFVLGDEKCVGNCWGSPRDSQILFSLSDLKYPIAVLPSNRLLRTMLSFLGNLGLRPDLSWETSTEQSPTRWHSNPRQINDRNCMEPQLKSQTLASSGWSRHKNILPRQICFDCFLLIVTQFRIASGLKSIFHNRPHVGICTASHVSMRLVLVSDSPIPKGPWELLWLVQTHRPVFGWVKLAPIKYEKAFVQRHMKSDEELFWKSTKFTTTTSVDWEKTGTRTSVSAGKKKLKMQSVGRSTTTTLNVNTNVKLWCSFATNFFARLLKQCKILLFKPYV